MVDTVNGKVRVRAWPRKRGQAKTAAQQAAQTKFAMAQLASKFASPQMMLDITNARAGTPVLPRDVFTRMVYNRLIAFIRTDGTKVYPMPARNDVSECLDTITQTPGATIIRGPEGWIEWQPEEIDPLVLRQTTVISSPVAAVEWLGAGAYSRLAVVIIGVSASVSSNRAVQLGTAGGSVFHTGAGDYHNILATGVDNAQSSMLLHSTGATAARSAAMVIGDNIAGQLKLCQPMPIPQLSYFNASLDKIQAMRVINFGGGNLTGGTVYFYGGT